MWLGVAVDRPEGCVGHCVVRFAVLANFREKEVVAKDEPSRDELVLRWLQTSGTPRDDASQGDWTAPPATPEAFLRGLNLSSHVGLIGSTATGGEAPRPRFSSRPTAAHSWVRRRRASRRSRGGRAAPLTRCAWCRRPTGP